MLTKKFTSNDSDIIISKAKAASGRKSSRKLDFDEFVHCLELIAAQKGVDAEKIYEKLLSSSASDSSSPPPPPPCAPSTFWFKDTDGSAPTLRRGGGRGRGGVGALHQCPLGLVR